MTTSGSDADGSHIAFIRLNMCGVIGSLSLRSMPFSASTFLIPCRIYHSRCNAGRNGSSAPSAMWRNLTADKYTFTVQCFNPVLAIDATKWHNTVSVAGTARKLPTLQKRYTLLLTATVGTLSKPFENNCLAIPSNSEMSSLVG